MPLTFTGNEVPDPLRLHGAKLPAGYVVILVITGETEKFTVVSTSLTLKNGTSVPYYVNTPKTDEYLSSGVFLVPHKPLLPLTEYTASVRFRRSDETETFVEWSFKTGKEIVLPPIGIKSPRKAVAPTSARSKRSGARRTKPSSRSSR